MPKTVSIARKSLSFKHDDETNLFYIFLQRKEPKFQQSSRNGVDALLSRKTACVHHLLTVSDGGAVSHP